MQQETEIARRKSGGTSPSATIHLRLLATSDLHAHLLAWDYHANRHCAQRGLSRVASLIRAARAEQPQSLLFDNGDFLHGSVLGDALTEAGGKHQPGRPLWANPVITALNALKYDAITLGNHEFGHGLAYLRRALAAAQFPVVCSNLYFKPTRGAAIAQTHVILERQLKDSAGQSHTVKIGILGFIPPQTMIWERRYLRGRASIEDIVTSARYWIPELRRAGADVVIALSHSGLGALDSGPGAENASAALTMLEGLDAVVAGHTHLIAPQQPMTTPPGVPAVMPGFFGSHLGVIDLRLRKTPNGWRVYQSRAEARAIYRRDPETGLAEGVVRDDPEIVKLALPIHQRLLGRAEEVISQTDVAMNTYFALVADSPALKIVARAQRDHYQRAVAGTPGADLPILSAAAPFKAGGRGGPENYTDIPVGPLRRRHVNDLYIHPNSLAAVRVTGEQVRLWLERSVSLFNQIQPGSKDAGLISAVYPSFNFDVIDGVTYRVDLSQPAMFDPFGAVLDPSVRRIVDLQFEGRPIPADRAFVMVTNSYRAAGGVGFVGASPDTTIYEVDTDTRQILEQYLRESGSLSRADCTPAWTFVPMPGTSVVFETSPYAVAHLAEVPQIRPEPLEQLQTGFRRFRLWL